MGGRRRRGPLRRVIQKVRSNRGARGGGQRSREHGLGIFKRRPRSERQGLFGGEGLFGGGGIFPERGGTTVRVVEKLKPVPEEREPVPEERDPVPVKRKPKITIIPLDEDTEEKEIDPYTGLPEKPLQRVNVNKMWEGSPDLGAAVGALLDMMRGDKSFVPGRRGTGGVYVPQGPLEPTPPEKKVGNIVTEDGKHYYVAPPGTAGRKPPRGLRQGARTSPEARPLPEDEHWRSRYGHPDQSEVEGSLGIPDEVEEVTTITKVAPEPRPSDQEVAIQRAEQAPGGTGYVEVEPPPSRVNEDANWRVDPGHSYPHLGESWTTGDREEGSHEQQQEALDKSLSYHLGGGFLGGQPESTAGELRRSMSASTPEPERRPEPEPRAQKRYPRTRVLDKNPKLNQGGFY